MFLFPRGGLVRRPLASSVTDKDHHDPHNGDSGRANVCGRTGFPTLPSREIPVLVNWTNNYGVVDPPTRDDEDSTTITETQDATSSDSTVGRLLFEIAAADIDCATAFYPHHWHVISLILEGVHSHMRSTQSSVEVEAQTAPGSGQPYLVVEAPARKQGFQTDKHSAPLVPIRVRVDAKGVIRLAFRQPVRLGMGTDICCRGDKVQGAGDRTKRQRPSPSPPCYGATNLD
ncbi:hypothetical protein SODALDRAFT_355009 [Sodiomyces alkalinus F11]|uniref:Uncharacterized protein n=1 Tax=Sodiomyces alkalinus (strain CBS 110278 / VKM F-3762 / F11) TaxID=1314773 RepID=A0A3N2Q7T2_SODAK|nr:hypothetical protein SODALDRAFT_355009 [Sodiomyces alkalinus F11]ROT42820.1 hypothetical protein SODALDRAFT_355009 [Sodiomyces alkalinus F11]